VGGCVVVVASMFLGWSSSNFDEGAWSLWLSSLLWPLLLWLLGAFAFVARKCASTGVRAVSFTRPLISPQPWDHS